MRKVKMLCIALAPLATGAMVIVVVVVTKGRLLNMLLGHEFTEPKGWSIFSAIGAASSSTVMDCADISEWSCWQIGRRVRLCKAVVWSLVFCMLLWTALLLVARIGWGSPVAWLTEGCFAIATCFFSSYTLVAVLKMILRATEWARNEIKKSDS